MKLSRLLIVLVCLVGVAALADDEKDKEKERTEIRQMSHQTLTRLYKEEPSAKAAIKKAYGYAVFSNTGIKILSRHLSGVSDFLTSPALPSWHTSNLASLT